MASHLSTIFLVYILSDILSAVTLTQAEPLNGVHVTRVEDNSKYSYVVSIARKNDRYPEEEMHICSGVLIAKNFVLTAAHCFDDCSLDEIQIIIGSVDLRQGTKYDVSMWITYHQWVEIESNKNIEQDDLNEIAMIKLSEEVCSQVAKPASLSSKKHKDLNYHHVKLVGWGKTLESLKHPSRYLHRVRVKVLPNAVCEKMSTVFYENKSQFDKYFCTTGKPHAFLADGDSGGPVMKKGLVVGISVGACPKYGQSDLYVESLGNYKFNVHIGIEFYQNFISDVLKNY